MLTGMAPVILATICCLQRGLTGPCHRGSAVFAAPGRGFSRLVPGWEWCMVDGVVNGAGVARVFALRCHPQRCARRLNDVAILHFRRAHLTTHTTWRGGATARGAARQEDVRWSSERVRTVIAGRRA
jgi:hypothetical protein